MCCLGFTTRPSTGHWVFRFLEALQLGCQLDPDFLLPSWTDSVPFSTPCSYHHALALIRFYSQCCWLSPALLSPEQAANLSTHSMKSTLLAAAGQQGHHKKSVQFYSRDDVWPSPFLQRDILVDVSTGWRPLTSQARGAKQPLPEPSFCSPVIAQEDLNIFQMLPPKAATPSPAGKPPANSETVVHDSDEQGEAFLLPLHLLIQANHRKRKLPFQPHHLSW